MLLLTRRPKEAIIINDNISIRILGIAGNNIKIGIEAPKNLSVHREEVYKKIQQEKAYEKANEGTNGGD